jgi:hypothetical protein
VIPRRAASRGISLLLRSDQREIPRFARNDKINCFLRSLISLRILLMAVTKDYFERGLAIIFLYCSASLGAQIISIVLVFDGINLRRNLSRASHGSV